MFIKVTTLNSSSFYINSDRIESMGVIDHKTYILDDDSFLGNTFVIPTGLPEENKPYIVKESPEEILEKIRAAELEEMRFPSVEEILGGRKHGTE